MYEHMRRVPVEFEVDHFSDRRHPGTLDKMPLPLAIKHGYVETPQL